MRSGSEEAQMKQRSVLFALGAFVGVPTFVLLVGGLRTLDLPYWATHAAISATALAFLVALLAPIFTLSQASRPRRAVRRRRPLP